MSYLRTGDDDEDYTVSVNEYEHGVKLTIRHTTCGQSEELDRETTLHQLNGWTVGHSYECEV